MTKNISPWDIDQETENYFKYTLKYGESQYDIDQKTENYFKYTQYYEPNLAKNRQENSELPQNYHVISTKKLKITSNMH